MNKIKAFVDKILGLKSLGNTTVKPTNQNSIKISKVFEPTNKITWL